MYSGLSETIWRNSPEYSKAYQEGYEQAKKEMADKLKEMQALYFESTATAKTEKG